jgi:hypothetical protein
LNRRFPGAGRRLPGLTGVRISRPLAEPDRGAGAGQVPMMAVLALSVMCVATYGIANFQQAKFGEVP